MSQLLILDRPDNVPGVEGQWTQICDPTPIVAWAWLHVLRTGVRPMTVAELDAYAMDEKARWKTADMKPKAFKPRVLPTPRSAKKKILTDGNGPSVA